MKCKAYVTARKSGKKLWCEGETTAREFTDAIPPRDQVGYHPGDVEGNMIPIYPSVRYQKWQGFGAAFTQSAAEQKKIERAVLADKRQKIFGIVLCLSRSCLPSLRADTAAKSDNSE